jgi:hypothetical protein
MRKAREAEYGVCNTVEAVEPCSPLQNFEICQRAFISFIWRLLGSSDLTFYYIRVRPIASRFFGWMGSPRCYEAWCQVWRWARQHGPRGASLFIQLRNSTNLFD